MTDKQRQAYDEWLRTDASDPADVGFAIWTASRKLALEEAERIVARKAESIANANTYRGRVHAAVQHAVLTLREVAAAIRQERNEQEGGK